MLHWCSILVFGSLLLPRMPENPGSLEIAIISDQKTLVPGENCCFLIEFWNRSPERLFLRALHSPQLDLEVHVEDLAGKSLRGKGHLFPGMEDPPSYSEIPPGGKLHREYEIDGKSRMFRLPQEGRFKVWVEVKVRPQTLWTLDEGEIERRRLAQDSSLGPPWNKRIEITLDETFVSNSLEFSVSPQNDEEIARQLGRHEKFKAFLREMAVRWANFKIRERMKTPMQEGDNPPFGESDFRNLVSSDPSFHGVDDAWFKFAISDQSTLTVSERDRILRQLIQAYPNSTGAIRTQAYRGWPEGYLKHSR